MPDNREWTSTHRVGISLGCGFCVVAAVLFVGASAEGDPATAQYLALPALVLGALGTAFYGLLPRRRVALIDQRLHLDGRPCAEARISDIGTRGEGFTTTRAFKIAPGEGRPEVWLTRWSFPQLEAMHQALAEVLPVDPLPAPTRRPGQLF